VIAAFPGLADPAFVEARQVNLETIHQHNVVAERFGTLGEIRREFETGAPTPKHTSRREWLDAPG
jgi:GTP cyclohydrolase I/GTP cyclohydrolase-4